MTTARRRHRRIELILGLAVLFCAFSVSAQGVVRFANLAPGVNAPFFGSDGTNRLAGSNFVAALYVAPPGPAATALQQVGPVQPFQQGALAGFWLPADVPLPGFRPGEAVRVQVRFWDRARAPFGNFEEAEAAGLELGVAEIPVLLLNADGSPTPLIGLASAGLIPTLTLSRGSPLSVGDPGLTSTGSQFHELCGVAVGTNRWFRLSSPQDALAVLNTDFSSIDTVMAAFTGSIVDLAGLNQVTCNDDRAPGRSSSAITFPVHANTLYLICVAGKNNANGPVRLTYATGIELSIRRWMPGDELEVSWPADGSSYRLEMSTEPLDPDSWSAVPTAPILGEGFWIMPITIGPPHRNYSYRLRAQP